MMTRNKDKSNAAKREGLKMFSVWIPADLKQKLDIYKAHNGGTLEVIATALLTAGLAAASKSRRKVAA